MTSDSDLPDDPVSSREAELIGKETGGQVLGRIERNGRLRLTIGAYQHPHKTMHSLNTVTIRMYRDGTQTEAVDLGDLDVQEIFRALHEAVAICWPGEPDPPFTPRTDWYAPPDDSDDTDGEDEDDRH